MGIYRQYKNPRELEKELAELKAQIPLVTDEEEMNSLHEAIMEMEDEVNFAWQDEEYDELCGNC